MKRFLLLVLFCICLCQSSCERDDICAESTPTTPLLIIRFYDFNNPTELKVPANLAIAEAEATSGLIFNSDSIAIPLRTDQDMTSFRFIINSDDPEDPEDGEINEDNLNLFYERTEDYVSKACGFRVTYDALSETRAALPDGFWIQDIIIDNPSIVDQNEAHIRILH